MKRINSCRVRGILCALLCVSMFFLQGCTLFSRDWYEDYPIAYGEGITWICENDEIPFYAFFVTKQIQYGHYGSGKLTCGETTVEYQMMFLVDRVTFLFDDNISLNFIDYFSGTAEFNPTCMKVTIDEIDDERFSDLLGKELAFYKEEQDTATDSSSADHASLYYKT